MFIFFKDFYLFFFIFRTCFRDFFIGVEIKNKNNNEEKGKIGKNEKISRTNQKYIKKKAKTNSKDKNDKYNENVLNSDSEEERNYDNINAGESLLSELPLLVLNLFSSLLSSFEYLKRIFNIISVFFFLLFYYFSYLLYHIYM